MESAVDRIIFECVDTVLSQSEFLDKSQFYHLLETSYDIKPEEIGQNYDTFHSVLSNTLGVNHYSIERAILQVMKQRTQEGIYAHTDEITAFSKITAVYMKETDANIRRIRELTNLEKYTKSLEEKVKEADDRMKSVERLTAIGETAAMVGHDIRNPLQALTGDLYLASEELKEMPDGEHKLAIQESFEAMQENISYINKIVADLQDYARPLTPSYGNVNFAGLASDIVGTIPIPNNVTVEINVNADFWVNTDPAFIRRILTNLVNNAIQAMPNGGKLMLTASKQEKKTCIIVSDNGNGIPDEVKEKMFTPLVTTRSKGQGLGLAVVKRLVNALGGTITFESESGKGTTFFIELPIKY